MTNPDEMIAWAKKKAEENGFSSIKEYRAYLENNIQT